MDDLISIVVPIYKVEKYLKKCIDSIVNQTYKNIEIILVDDGSPDNCGNIIEEYRKADERVKTIHQKNGGLSDARNNGIKIASGKYILYIDSDDWIEKNMVEVLYKNIVDNDADISICEFIEEDDNETELSNKNYNGQIVVFNKIEAIQDLIEQRFITNHAWNKLYKKELFDNIEYPKGQLMEDISTTYKLFENSKKIVYQNIALYHYIQRGSSILGNITQKRIEDQEDAIFKRNNYLIKKYPECANIIKIDNLKTVKDLYYLAVMGKHKKLYKSEKYKNYYQEYKKIYRELKKFVNDNDKKSLNLFYTNRELYKIYVELKMKIKDKG